jgi:hypothetical protein
VLDVLDGQAVAEVAIDAEPYVLVNDPVDSRRKRRKNRTMSLSAFVKVTRLRDREPAAQKSMQPA